MNTTNNPEEEKAWAVRLMHRLDVIQDLLTLGPMRRAVTHLAGAQAWPSVAGSYNIGDRQGSIAVCTLTTTELMEPLSRLPGVAVAGRVYTANLGIEKILINITDNPNIRYLILCGRDSPLFHPGQTLRALWVHGVTPERRIISAAGYLPELRNLQHTCIECFRNQVELIDLTGETNIAQITARIQELASRDSRPFPDSCDESEALARLGGDGSQGEAATFRPLQPGGRRQPLAYDPKGFFIITLDRKMGEMVVRHYLPDNTPAHIIRGRSSEAVLLGLLRENLISQMSHAAYLGTELAKAETALKLGLQYEQDQALRVRGQAEEKTKAD